MRDGDVDVTVVVVIEPEAGVIPADMAQSRLFGDVGESAVTVVAIQTVAGAFGKFFTVHQKWTGEVDEVQVIVAVVVVVDPAEARADIFRQQRIAAVVEMVKIDARVVLDFEKLDAGAGVGNGLALRAAANQARRTSTADRRR